MKKKFIEKDRLQRLQHSIRYLDNYRTPQGEVHHVGPNINTESVRETALLRELGLINERKEAIILELMSERQIKESI